MFQCEPGSGVGLAEIGRTAELRFPMQAGKTARPAFEDEAVRAEAGGPGRQPPAPRTSTGTSTGTGTGHYRKRPRLASIAAFPSAPFRFQSRRSSARTLASVLATIHWFSRTSFR